MSIITKPIKYIKGSGGVIEIAIYDGSKTNDALLDISGSTVMFYAVCKEDNTKKFSGPMAVLSPTLGLVSYTVQATDFPIVGQYECEIAIDIGQPLPIKAGGILIYCVASVADQFTPEGV